MLFLLAYVYVRKSAESADSFQRISVHLHSIEIYHMGIDGAGFVDLFCIETN